jgi:EH domain-containing protein 1
MGLVAGLLASSATAVGLVAAGLMVPEPHLLGAVAGGAGILGFVLWVSTIGRWLRRRFHREQLKNLDRLTPMQNQTRRDSWQSVRDLVYMTLKRTEGRIALKQVKAEYQAVHRIYMEGAKDIREALNELSGLRAGEAPSWTGGRAEEDSREFPFAELSRTD